MATSAIEVEMNVSDASSGKIFGASTIFQLNRYRLVRAFHEKPVGLYQQMLGRRMRQENGEGTGLAAKGRASAKVLG